LFLLRFPQFRREFKVKYIANSYRYNLGQKNATVDATELVHDSALYSFGRKPVLEGGGERWHFVNDATSFDEVQQAVRATQRERRRIAVIAVQHMEKLYQDCPDEHAMKRAIYLVKGGLMKLEVYMAGVIAMKMEEEVAGWM
jgi:hypothetical protein